MWREYICDRRGTECLVYRWLTGLKEVRRVRRPPHPLTIRGFNAFHYSGSMAKTPRTGTIKIAERMDVKSLLLRTQL